MTLQEEREHFVKYGDIETLREVVKKALSDGYDKERLSRIAQNRYSKERMSDEYLDLYMETMQDIRI